MARKFPGIFSSFFSVRGEGSKRGNLYIICVFFNIICVFFLSEGLVKICILFHLEMM